MRTEGEGLILRPSLNLCYFAFSFGRGDGATEGCEVLVDSGGRQGVGPPECHKVHEKASLGQASMSTLICLGAVKHPRVSKHSGTPAYSNPVSFFGRSGERGQTWLSRALAAINLSLNANPFSIGTPGSHAGPLSRDQRCLCRGKPQGGAAEKQRYGAISQQCRLYQEPFSKFTPCLNAAYT